MGSHEISLDARTLEFRTLLSRCEFTMANGKSVDIETGMQHAMEILTAARKRDSSVFLVGNGGSAGIASHATVDFVHVAKLRAHTVHDPSLLTCMSNDYGYENGYAKILGHLARAHDVLIAISSSGNSANIRNAAATVTQAGGTVITLSGFKPQNPLRSLGEINIWLDSHDYGLVEIGHQFILHNLADRFGRNKESR
ncbi:MAG: SIS domain-containing protein [Gammaproteobacteria bacterium]|nr:SIS domain-containing protein [Gammaproteobacteria bacterium]